MTEKVAWVRLVISVSGSSLCLICCGRGLFRYSLCHQFEHCNVIIDWLVESFRASSLPFQDSKHMTMFRQSNIQPS
jgi:hypothetical protein